MGLVISSANAVDTIPMSTTVSNSLIQKGNYSSTMLASTSYSRAVITIMLCFDFAFDSHSKATLDDLAYMDSSYFSEKGGMITVLVRGRNYLNGNNLMIMYTPADGNAAYSLFSENDGSFAMLKTAIAEKNGQIYENEVADIVEVCNQLAINYYADSYDETAKEESAETHEEIKGSPAAGEIFSSGLLAYRENGKWGYIDTDGNVVIPFQWDYAEDFDQGYAMVFTGTLKEVRTLSTENETILRPDKGQFGVIDIQGNYVIPMMDCRSISIWHPIENDITVSFGDYDTTFEYWRTDGTKIGNERWEDSYSPDGGKWICASIGGKWGYVSRKAGDVVIGFQYDVAENFVDGIACVGKRTDDFKMVYEYIGENGLTLIKNEGWDVAYSFVPGAGIARVFKGTTLYDGEIADKGKYALIDQNGSLLCDYIWDDVEPYESGLSVVVLESRGKKKYGIVDKAMNYIVEPVWDYISYESGDRAKVFQGETNTYGSPENGLFSYVDENGKLITEMKWKDATNFKPDGYAAVATEKANGNKVWGIIDKEGNVVVSPAYDEIPDSKYIYELYSDNLARVKLDGKYGYVNKEGEVLISIQWDKAERFNEHKAIAWKGGELYIIETDGTFRKLR